MPRRRTTTVHIPRQRGRRSRHTPFVVVVPHQPTWAGRIAEAAGRALWKHRRTLLPTWVAIGAGLAVTIAHLTAPWLALPLALAAAAGPGWLAWAHRWRPSTSTLVRRWRYGIAAAVLVAGTWAAASVGFGPTAGLLEVLWLLQTITAQTVWFRMRAATARLAETPIKENLNDRVKPSA
ncbi:hypothetical protein [Streptomyces sp. 7N604]|uniref:hypothetical protein n=1 Tax=Streptomyces sp. 7N604 TaxID=3457415 RepID=UPI003FD10E88